MVGRTIAVLFGVVVVVGIVCGLVWLVGSSNPTTEAGYVGYVTQGAVFGHKKFLTTQRGPISYGRTWMADIINVSVTPYTYSEKFDGDNAVLSKDNLKVEFAVHTVFKVDTEKVQMFVEEFSMGDAHDPDEVVEVAYDNYLKEPLRTFARDEIQQLEGLAIKENIKSISDKLYTRVQELVKDTPFKVSSVVVGNIQYPATVANAVVD